MTMAGLDKIAMCLGTLCCGKICTRYIKRIFKKCDVDFYSNHLLIFKDCFLNLKNLQALAAA